MRRLLYIDLKPLIENDEKMINNENMADALLPDNMKYENGEFLYSFRLGEARKIDPPNEGEESALKDIDPNFPTPP